MANSFYLKVISANRIFFSGRCESIVVPEFDGEKEILAHHENMVIAINRGDMRFKPEGENEWQSNGSYQGSKCQKIINRWTK